MASAQRDPYAILGIPRTATSDQVKKAYRLLARKYHPDKNDTPDTDRFKEAVEAYEILSDPKKRQSFDRFGFVPHTATSEIDPRELYRRFFPSKGVESILDAIFGASARKLKAVVIPVHVSLEEAFTGRSRTYSITRNILCPSCQGTGSFAPTDLITCAQCKGQGYRRTAGTVNIFVSIDACEYCHGQGYNITKACTQCAGSRVIQKKESVKVAIPPGVPLPSNIILPNLTDEQPGRTAGDLVFSLQQVPHGIFTRRGDDLWMRVSITLRDALCGFALRAKGIDGTRLYVPVDEVIATGDERVVPGEGMPVASSPTNARGNLIVHFDVSFPRQMSPTQRALFDRLLSSHSPISEADLQSVLNSLPTVNTAPSPPTPQEKECSFAPRSKL